MAGRGWDTARYARETRRAMVITGVWAAVYTLLAILLPFGTPDRPLLMEVAFIPSHLLAAWTLWCAAKASADAPNRAGGLLGFFAAQAIGVANSVVWVVTTLGLVGPLSIWYQVLGVGMTVCYIYGIARLVPVQRSGALGIPWLDAALLLIASGSIGWYFVGWPLISSGLETGSSFAWFALISTIDSQVGLLALMAWVYPTDRLNRSAAATLATSQVFAVWGDIGIETGLVAGTYTSGEPFDAVFAISTFLLTLAAWRALGPSDVAAEAPSVRRAARTWERALLPTIATGAVSIPVVTTALTDEHGDAFLVPVVLLVLFVLVLQWRQDQLVQARSRAIAKRFSVERDLALSRQFASIGRFAGQIAHDFNNVLSGIVSYVELLKMGMVRPQELPQVLDIMEQSAQRGVTLNRRLQGILRGQEAEPQPTELAALVRAVTDSLRRVMPDEVETVLSLPRTPVMVSLRPGDGDQLVLNLLVNARDALPTGGRITVTVRAESDVAVLEVEDNGTGMPAAVRERIFEPLFTTKESGRGTGLGLATVRTVVDTADGSIAVWSEEGRGTRFTIRLPILRAEG